MENDEYDLQAYGNALRNCIAEKEMLQKEYANLIGKSILVLRFILYGEFLPDEATLELNRRVFGLDIGNFKKATLATSQEPKKVHPYSEDIREKKSAEIIDLDEYRDTR